MKRFVRELSVDRECVVESINRVERGGGAKCERVQGRVECPASVCVERA